MRLAEKLDIFVERVILWNAHVIVGIGSILLDNIGLTNQIEKLVGKVTQPSI